MKNRWVPVLVAILLVAGPVKAAENDLKDLQARIDEAGSEAVVLVPPGTWTRPLIIKKPLTLKGQSRETCILKGTSDQPLIEIKSTQPVLIEGLTLIWQRATSGKTETMPCGVGFRDATVTIRDCRFVAPGNNPRCPSAVTALGFSELNLEKCRFEGFDFTIQYWQGAGGKVADCVVLKPGHCGITVGADCVVEVVRNLVAGSEFHGVRCTGGTLVARDNLIVRNKNRGFYLGNSSAKGKITNNLILGNGTGISAFAQTQVEIAHNILSASDYAGLDSRDSCRIQVRDNILHENTQGFVVLDETRTRRFNFQRNTFWGNKTNAVQFELSAEMLRVDPQFKNPAEGDYAVTADNLRSSGQGLTDSEVIRSLWKVYASLRRDGLAP